MQDPMWIRGLLGVHVAAGAVSFVMAPIALATAKGGRAHRRWGKVYFWAMAVVASTALALLLTGHSVSRIGSGVHFLTALFPHIVCWGRGARCAVR